MNPCLRRFALCVAAACATACAGGGTDGAGSSGSDLFASTVTNFLLAGRGPSAILAADLDRDGRLDLVLADAGAGTVGVMLGLVDGGFGSLAEFGVGGGSEPVGIALGDVNLDGRLDVAVADQAHDRVVVLVGDGSGALSFGGSVGVTSGGQPSAVAIADLDRDGFPDLAATNFALGTVSVAQGNGDGTFGVSTSIPLAGGLVPSAIVAGDFDRDGKPDLAIASLANGRVTVLLGRGDLTFHAPIPVAAAGGGVKLSGIAAEDVDADGVLDLVLADWTDGTVQTVLGVGDGTFGAPVSSPAGGDPSGVALGDFDADGRTDAAVTLRGTNRVAILLGVGGGAFALVTAQPSGGTGAGGVAVGDFDGDGSLDVAAANASSSSVGVLLGRNRARAPTFAGAVSVPIGAGSEPSAVALVDLDRDGALDLVTADRGHATVSVALGDGLGGVGPAAPFSVGAGTRPVALAVLDADRDGRPDVAVADALGASVVVLFGSGTGTLAFLSSIALPTGAAPTSIAVADFDHDGNADLVIGNGGLGSVSVALGRGDGTFDAATTVEIAPSFHAKGVVTSDFNRDGRPDFAAVSGTTGNVTVLLGNGIGGFVFGPTIGAGSAPGLTGIAVLDANANGRPDLAVSDSPDGKAAVMLGASGPFDPAIPYPSGATPAALVAADVDRDGRIDLLVALEGLGDIGVMRGVGDGTFLASVPFAAGGAATVALAVGDLDRDGRLDVVVANRGSDAAAILLGN